MNESLYQIGDTISGTIGAFVSKTYCIEFNGGFLTVGEDNIGSSIIEVLQLTIEVDNG